jgi:hypothetical protein
MSKNKNLEIKIIRTKIEIQKTKKTKLYFFRRGERQKKKSSLAINTIPSPTSSVLRGREHRCVSNNTMKA